MRVTIFGTGYVGLVTGTCFAEMGNDVKCIDVDADKIERLRNGEVPIFEPGLAPMVRSNVARNTLTFSTDAAEGINFGEIIFIAVGTPQDEDGSADLQYVLNVARTIGNLMNSEKIIVDKSTVPVGTADLVTEAIENALAERSSDIRFHVVSNPEFLKEGAAIDDFMKPDRIVIGSTSQYAANVMTQLYAPFNRNHDKVIHMDPRSAELTKYAANVMLAARISLMNELANLADRLDADIEEVRRGIGLDPRIGHHFIYAGTGYGGSCFPKDVKALLHTSESLGFSAEILRSVDRVNGLQKRVLFDKLMSRFGKVDGLTFAMWGLAFKPNTDDMREAPSLVLIDLLTQNGANVVAYDPEAHDVARRLLGGNNRFSLAEHRSKTLENADALLVVTEWNEFRSPDFDAMKELLKQPIIFDGRNLYDPEFLRGIGFEYYGIGRAGDPN